MEYKKKEGENGYLERNQQNVEAAASQSSRAREEIRQDNHADRELDRREQERHQRGGVCGERKKELVEMKMKIKMKMKMKNKQNKPKRRWPSLVQRLTSSPTEYPDRSRRDMALL